MCHTMDPRACLTWRFIGFIKLLLVQGRVIEQICKSFFFFFLFNIWQHTPAHRNLFSTGLALFRPITRKVRREVGISKGCSGEMIPPCPALISTELISHWQPLLAFGHQGNLLMLFWSLCRLCSANSVYYFCYKLTWQCRICPHLAD